ncbi:threonine aldolase [Haematococcus lacustris]
MTAETRPKPATALDFRSDTVTRPSPGMLAAMMSAPVGDDVWGDDPTVNKLQDLAAAMFGYEAALFCPSGTMTNQIAIKVHTQPGDELICSDTAHIYCYEGGGIAFNSGVQARALPGDKGRLTAAQVAAAINAEDAHYPRTSLVCLENSTNKGGGAIYSLQTMTQIAQLCRERGLKLHLDGARLFNAIIASRCGTVTLPQTPATGPTAPTATANGNGAQQPHTAEHAPSMMEAETAAYGPRDVGCLFDSISLCLSKGLGCPVGSLLMGSSAFITRAHRVRKVLGGGMRQAGFLAAAGLYALEHNVERLADDHQQAQRLAAALAACSPAFVAQVAPVATNLVIWTAGPGLSAQAVIEAMAAEGVLVSGMGGPLLRMVTHLDVNDCAVETACAALQRVQGKLCPGC